MKDHLLSCCRTNVNRTNVKTPQMCFKDNLHVRQKLSDLTVLKTFLNSTNITLGCKY